MTFFASPHWHSVADGGAGRSLREGLWPAYGQNPGAVAQFEEGAGAVRLDVRADGFAGVAVFRACGAVEHGFMPRMDIEPHVGVVEPFDEPATAQVLRDDGLRAAAGAARAG